MMSMLSNKPNTASRPNEVQADTFAASQRPQTGFTLMEILIVVAIIAILVAVAIPVFTSQLERTRQATCSANMRSLQAVVSVNVLDGSATSFEDAFNSAYSQNDSIYTCPDNGTFSLVSPDAAAIKCSVHTQTSFTDEELFEALAGSIDGYPDPQQNTYSTYDSVNRTYILGKLDQNVKKALEGKTWTYSRTDNKLYIYDGDITNHSTGETITITVYNMTSHDTSTKSGYFVGTKGGQKVLAPY